MFRFTRAERDRLRREIVELFVETLDLDEALAAEVIRRLPDRLLQEIRESVNDTS